MLFALDTHKPCSHFSTVYTLKHQLESMSRY